MSMKIDNWSTVDSALEALRDNDKADVEHYIRELERENNELRKDKERLDWLMKKGLAWNGCYKGDWLDGEWMYGNSTFNSDARDDIDKAMKEGQ